MGTLIRAEEYKDGKLTRLGTPFSRRAKLLDFFYAAMFFVGAAGFAALLLTHWRESVGAFVIAILGIIAFLIASYRFINRATDNEGRASFVYQGQQVRFGKELASWDFDELEVLFYDITGNEFLYTDKFEQELPLKLKGGSRASYRPRR